MVQQDDKDAVSEVSSGNGNVKNEAKQLMNKIEEGLEFDVKKQLTTQEIQ